MKIVIDIPDKQYEYLSKIVDAGQEPLGYFERVIMRGTPLPKGHGKLMILSEDKLKENLFDLDFSCQKWISVVGLSYSTVAIIETDKVGSEE